MVKGAKAITWDWGFLQQLPDNTACYELSDKQVDFLVTLFRQAQWSTRWQNKPVDFDDVLAFVLDTQQAILTPLPCGNVPTGGGNGCQQLPDGVVWDGENLTIEDMCNMTIIINQYGCGCGCGGNVSSGNGGGVSFGGGQSSGGGASGSWVAEVDKPQSYSGNVLTQCDLVTGGLLDYIIDQMKEILVLVAGSSNNIENIIDGLAALVETFSIGTITSDGVDWLTNISVDMAANAVVLFDDLDFRDNVKTAWVKTFGSDTYLSSITRNMLLSITGNIRQFWYVSQFPVEARALWSGLSRMVNITKINQRLPIYIGACVQQDYTYYAAAAGMPYTPPTDVNSLPAPIGFNYDWGRRWEFISSQDSWQVAYESQWINGSGYWRSFSPSNRFWNGCLYAHLNNIISGVIVEIDTAMIGDLNQIAIIAPEDGTILYSRDNVTDTRIVCPIPDVSIPTGTALTVRLDEWQDNSNTNPYIVAGELYGYGTEPTDGGTSI